MSSKEAAATANPVAVEPKPPVKMVAVPRPDNIFNDPFTVGVYGGAAAGLLGGYLFGGKILPFIRKTLGALYQGQSKVAILVREDLRMSKGKIGSQCSHATLQMYRSLSSPLTRYNDGKSRLAAWELSGQTTVVLRVPNLDNLKLAEKVAKELNVPFYSIADAGRTEVAPGSLTVCSVGPAGYSDMEKITGNFRPL